MRKKSLYLVIMAASLLALAASLYARYSVEHAAKAVDIMLDYNETKLLAKQSEKPMQDWLKSFKGWGAGTVAIEEESFKSLIEVDNRPIKLTPMNSIINDYALANQVPVEIKKAINEGTANKYDLVVSTPSQTDFDFIKTGLASRYPADFYKFYDFNDVHYIVLHGTETDALYTEVAPVFDTTKQAKQRPAELVGSKLQDIGIGFDSKKIEMVKSAGLKISPRPRNYASNSSKLLDAYFADLKKYDMKPDYIVFSGSSIVGYDNKINPIGRRILDQTTVMTASYNASNMGKLQELIDRLKADGITVGMVESGVQRQYVEQDGIDVVADRLNYEVVRVFPVVKYIQQRFKFYNYTGAEEIGNTIFRAVIERNIRSVYFRPFLLNETQYVTDPVEYDKMFKELEMRLGEHGINLATHGKTLETQKASTMKHNQPRKLALALMGIGIVAAGMLLLRMLVPLPELLELGMLIAGTLLTFPLVIVKPGLFMTVYALVGSIVFPCLAVVIFMEYARERIASGSVKKLPAILGEGALMVLVCGALAILGGLYVGGLLSRSQYLIEMEIFRGVKLSGVTPMVLVMIVYLIKFGFKRSKEELEENRHFYGDLIRIFDENIKIVYVLVAGAVGMATFIYIARTGHETSIQPSTTEMIMRNLLEYNLPARPRTKEFLMAFPALMVLIQFANRGLRKWILPLGLIVAMGVASVADTFCHLRSPIMLSLVREISGMALGVAIGAVAVVVLHVLLNLLNSLIKGRKIHE